MIGFVIFSVVLGEAEILYLAISPQHYREGWGKYLLDDVLSRLHREHTVSVFLEVRECNSGAQLLYSKCGFSPVGRRKHYYRLNDKREDAIVFFRTLTT